MDYEDVCDCCGRELRKVTKKELKATIEQQHTEILRLQQELKSMTTWRDHFARQYEKEFNARFDILCDLAKYESTPNSSSI